MMRLESIAGGEAAEGRPARSQTMIKEIEEELGFAFTPEQTACLVKVLDRIWQREMERAADVQALQQGLAALTEEVNRLTAAQQATDRRLAEFERRTEERFAALAEFQRRTEERLERLEATVERLAAAQARTEQRVDNDSGARDAFGRPPFDSTLPACGRFRGIALQLGRVAREHQPHRIAALREHPRGDEPVAAIVSLA